MTRTPGIRALTNELLSRVAIQRQLGTDTYGGTRDVYEALGYPKVLTYRDFRDRYDRQDVAKAIVEAYPDATWGNPPVVREEDSAGMETPFEQAVHALQQEASLWWYLQRTDILAGLGRYAVLYLGFSDAAASTPDQPVEGGNVGLLYMQPYSEKSAEVDTWDEDMASPRFGLPEMYRVHLRRGGKKINTVRVHWSRILHVSDGLLESEVLGTPRLQSVYNRLIDLERIAGASGEAFWQAAYPGIALTTPPDIEAGRVDVDDDLRDELDAYVHQFQRWIAIQGANVEQLSAEIADPRGPFEVMVALIAAATRIPQRIILGSERGELASSQDEGSWWDRVDERRKNFAEPHVLRPLISRLVDFNVLPAPTREWYAEWPDVNALSEADRVEIGRKRGEVLAKFPGMDMYLSPEQFFQHMLGFTEDQASQLDTEEIQQDMVDEETEAAQDMEPEPDDLELVKELKDGTNTVSK